MTHLFQNAIDRFDQANAQDPAATALPYSLRMTQWLMRLEPGASEPLQLAARSQHLRRWMIPRNTFPMDRIGYLKWRRRLYDFHADQAAAILTEIGYDQATIARVRSLLRKESLKADPEMQTLEDAICLVFLENYFAEFSAKHERAKVIDIVRKTWKKMSPRGQNAAMDLHVSDEVRTLLAEALA